MDITKSVSHKWRIIISEEAENLKFRAVKAGLSLLYSHESESWIQKRKKFVELKQWKRSFYQVLRM